ncbi:MAG: BREX-2 system phosphatase PglZ, partial [Desulfobacterales bacterium]|nr:BREX-2 system phosphatase PglZ [Desulfobacterales bacterium]
VFRELMADLTEREWAELGGEDGAPLPPVIAAIPSWTRLSRTSLFCGAVREGGSHEERKGFAAHPALAPGRGAKKAPALFHKIALTDAEDGALSEELRETIASRAHRVVAAVINAVDDHLLKGDQTNPQWTADYIRALPALLYEARAAGRVVAILSDHGCVLESGTTRTRKGEGERWRAARGRVGKGEIRISGSRVLAEGARELITPWSEAIRYGAKKNGYHGGVSLQEMVTPMALLTSGDDRLDGWSELPGRTPPWWEEPGRRASGKSGPRDKQLRLFPGESGMSAPPRSAAKAPGWVDRLLACGVYQGQKSTAGRAPSDEVVRKLASALAAHGGPMPFSALSREMGVPESRLPGLIDSARPVLNVEGYAILISEEATRTAALDVEMLKRQFEIE